MKVSQRVVTALVLLAISGSSVVLAAQRSRHSTHRRAASTAFVTVTLPANQYVRLRLEADLGTRMSRVGDRFKSTVVTPVYRQGREVIAAGSTVGGRVTYVRQPQSRGREGALGVRFDTLWLPDGTRIALVGSLVELQDGSAGKMTEEGVLIGRSSKRRNIYFIGGGAAGGALLGALIGGGKGAGIGAAVGVGAGVAGALLKKGHNVEVKRGTEVGMALDRPLAVRMRR